MIKKQLISLALAGISTATAIAGGLLTNTNQNAAFLRQLSQEAVIDITGAYMNPAGVAFLKKGFHLSLNIQNAKQNRDITTTFPLFKSNISNPNPTHKFEGDAKAPVIPSFQAAYVADRWSVGACFALMGGGGKCEFDNGLGSFESLYSSQIISGVNGALQAANMAEHLSFGGYDMNAYMKGRQYFFGVTLGGTYKITNNLAAYVGLRGVIASCNYNGWVTDINAKLVATSTVGEAYQQAVEQQINAQLEASSISLNADQTGFGVAPIIGIDWKINNHWNVAAKYEFRTHFCLKNKTEMNDYAAMLAQQNPVLGQFADGSKIAADVPGFLTVGAMYSPIKELRINAGYHYFDDKNAVQYGDKQELVNGGTWEVLAGVEYDLCKWVTVSAGWQTTNYDLADGHLSDLSFVTSSHSVGAGVRVNVTNRTSVDLGWMQTFYKTRDVVTPTPIGDKVDHYYRTNRVLGLGVNIAF
ncbi:MAG: hypothetical protein PUD30_02800 [Muribaculaceae bacterium]|nr:hypothetical protein [Muribaculaceae bacterium]MDY3932259.1 hypothetical protein [Muribaculaceae bacterium]